MCVITTLSLAGIGTAIAAGASAVGTAAAAAGSALAAGAMTVGSAIATGATAAASAVGSGLAAIGGSITSGLSAAGSMIAEGATAAGSAIASGAEAAGSAIVSGAEAVGGTIAEGATAAVEGAQTAAASVGLADAPAGTALTGSKIATAEMAAGATDAGVSVNSVMSAELAEMGLTGNAASGTQMGAVAFEAAPMSTGELLAKGAIAAGAGIATGTMSYQSALAANEAQAKAYQQQAEQERIAADQSRIASALSAQNAKNARIKAGMEMEAGELQAADKARIARQEAGAGLAKVASQGVMIEGRKESVSTMYEADQKAELAYDQAKIIQNASMRAWGYMADAKSMDLEALGHQYAAYGHEVGAAGLRQLARDTRRNGRVSSATSGLIQGISTAASVGSLLI